MLNHGSVYNGRGIFEDYILFELQGMPDETPERIACGAKTGSQATKGTGEKTAMNCVTITVSTIAGCGLMDTFESMRNLARLLGCHVTANVNDALMVVTGDSTPGQFMDQFLRQTEARNGG